MTVESEKTNRREKALNAACEVFARHGYQKASMQDIADAAGMSKSVLFKYFGTKEDLYRAAFQMAADGIFDADNSARAGSAAQTDMFTALRRTVDARMELFARSPWVYSFAYAAAFDGDPFVRALVQRDYLRRNTVERPPSVYRGIRSDVPPDAAKKLILWVSQGFLEEKLAGGMAEPETLKREYEAWITILELLLAEKGEKTDETRI